MNMIAKFDGRCKVCGGELKRGTVIDWTRNGGATHTQGATCDAVKAAREAARQALYTANAPAAPVVVAPVVVAVAGIVALLTKAHEKGIKAPKVRFLAPSGGELRLSLAGGSTKYPGAVQVKIDGEWIGRIGADGVLAGPLARETRHEANRETLDAIAVNPADAAKKYGALMGKCSFCGKALTDAGSVEVGYGPVCADKFELPHTAKGTPKLSAVVAAQESEAA